MNPFDLLKPIRFIIALHIHFVSLVIIIAGLFIIIFAFVDFNSMTGLFDFQHVERRGVDWTNLTSALIGLSVTIVGIWSNSKFPNDKKVPVLAKFWVYYVYDNKRVFSHCGHCEADQDGEMVGFVGTRTFMKLSGKDGDKIEGTYIKWNTLWGAYFRKDNYIRFEYTIDAPDDTGVLRPVRALCEVQLKKDGATLEGRYRALTIVSGSGFSQGIVIFHVAKSADEEASPPFIGDVKDLIAGQKIKS